MDHVSIHEDREHLYFGHLFVHCPMMLPIFSQCTCHIIFGDCTCFITSGSNEQPWCRDVSLTKTFILTH